VHFVVLGVGVNLNAQSEHFPEELRSTATSLAITRGQRVPRALFAAALWNRLEEWLDLHLETGFDAVRQRWRELSCTLGQDVLVRTDRQEFRGLAEDIDASGALLVRTEGGSVERVLAGDVERLRPRVPGGR
jgi:BirA family biotin operon repressor/biotin-[acetyl-CoA-carboxylase] ligase